MVLIDKLVFEENPNIAARYRIMIDELEASQNDLQRQIDLEESERQEIRVLPDEFRRVFMRVEKLLKFGAFNHKKSVVDTFLNKVLVFQDRLEIYVNLLPNTMIGALETAVEPKILLNQYENSQIALQTDQNDKEKESDYMSDPTLLASNSWLTAEFGGVGGI